MSDKDRIDAIVSSAAIPGMLPVVNIDDHSMVDGFVYVNLALSEAILKCREFGFDDKDIIVDIVLCYSSPQKIAEYSKNEIKYLTAYDMWSRKTAVQDFFVYYQDIDRVIKGYPAVNFRHLIAP